MAKMTKSAILSTLAAKTGLTKKQAGIFVDELVTLAYKEAKNSFTVPGLGKLVLVNRKARLGRNPATGDQGQEGCEVPHRQSGEGRDPQVVR